MKTFYTSILLLALVATALADLPFKKKPQDFTTHVPADVANTLRSGTPVQRNDLALELGILAPNPSGAAKSSAPCVDFHHVEERPVTLRAGAANVVLVADSTECDSSTLLYSTRRPSPHGGTCKQFVYRHACNARKSLLPNWSSPACLRLRSPRDQPR